MDATVFALEVVSVLVFDLRYDSLAPRSAPHSNRTLWSSRPHKHSLCSCATSYPDDGSLLLFLLHTCMHPTCTSHTFPSSRALQCIDIIVINAIVLK